MRYPLIFILAVAGTLAAAGTSAQNTVGDVSAGAEFAASVCAACHGVMPGDEASPLPEAPTFESVANTRGMTETAIYAWMTSSHPTMPNLILEPEDLRNVAAYILSLEK